MVEVETEHSDINPDWYFIEGFSIAMPLDLSLAVAKYYGRGMVGVDFAQALASFMSTPWTFAILRDAVQ